jgi:predicted RNA-binding protein (TIGR00451 family)
MQVAFLNEVPLFYSDRDNHWFPTLRILHQYPDMMPKLRTDKGAIKFVLSGANIMCPGLTSPGATIHDEVRFVTLPQCNVVLSCRVTVHLAAHTLQHSRHG